MPIHYDTRNKRWRFQFRRVVSGRTVRATRLLPAAWDRARAEAFDRAESARLYSLAAGTLVESPSIETAVQLYLDHHRDARNHHRTAAALAALLPHYEGRTFAHLPDIAADYQREQRDTLAPATIRNRLAYLRAAVRWAWKHRRLGTEDPGARMVMPSVRNARQVYLTPAEVHRLADQCSRDAAAVIRLAFYCGLRWMSELMPRQPEDVIREGGTTYLRVAVTKTGRPRMVPVHPAAIADLKRLPFRAHPRTYYTEFEAARAAIGRPEVTMHDLRHSLASAIISAGGTLADVQGALHHQSIQSSARYAHLYPARLREVLFQVDGRRGRQTKRASVTKGRGRQKSAHKAAANHPKKAA